MKITLEIEAELWTKDAPLRIRSEIGSGQCKKEKFTVDLCMSGRAIYFMMGEVQISMPIEEFIRACLASKEAA